MDYGHAGCFLDYITIQSIKTEDAECNDQSVGYF